MAIIVNNGVQNIDGTPGAISGVFSNRPAATNLANGTLYFSTDNTTIYQTDNGVWIVYTGGGGGVVGPGVPTQVAFFTGTNTIGSNAQLYWDNVNNRLGVGGTGLNAAKLNVYDASKYASFGTTAGNNNNAIIFGKSTSSYIALHGTTGERKVLFNDSAAGVVNMTLYNSNSFVFSYDNVLGGTQLPGSLTQFLSKFYYSAGTNNHTVININTDIQTTGGVNTLRGVYYNPGGTTRTGTNQIAWENTEGEIIFGNLSSIETPFTFVDQNGKLKNSYLNNDDTGFQILSKFSGDITGIRLDFDNEIFQFGAIDRGNKTTFYMSDLNAVAYFTYINNTARGMYMDFINANYSFGDVSYNLSGIHIDINSQLERISTFYQNNQSGLLFDYPNAEFLLGDITNNCYINIASSGAKILFITTPGIYNFANVPVYTDNADALANGLVIGDIYRHNGGSSEQLHIVF